MSKENTTNQTRPPEKHKAKEKKMEKEEFKKALINCAVRLDIICDLGVKLLSEVKQTIIAVDRIEEEPDEDKS